MVQTKESKGKVIKGNNKLCPGQVKVTKGNNSVIRHDRVMVLVHCTSSQCA
jgi:hypothetical protein